LDIQHNHFTICARESTGLISSADASSTHDKSDGLWAPAGSDRTTEARAHRDGSPTGRGRVDASAPRGNDPQQRAAIIGQSEKD